MSVRVKELAVEGSTGQDVAVRGGSGYDRDIVRVTWLCGDSREFTADGIKAAVAGLDKVAKVGLPDVWVALKDRNGRQVVARIDGDELYVAETPTDTSSSFVSWSNLKKAIRKMQS